MREPVSREAARQRAFAFVETLWSPAAASLLGSKAEAVEYFTGEILARDERDLKLDAERLAKAAEEACHG